MRNTKEIKPILSAILCINQCGAKDEDISMLCQYAFNNILDGSANLLTLCCIGKSKKDIMPEIEQVLKEDTKYMQYKEIRNEHKKQ